MWLSASWHIQGYSLWIYNEIYTCIMLFNKQYQAVMHIMETNTFCNLNMILGIFVLHNCIILYMLQLCSIMTNIVFLNYDSFWYHDILIYCDMLLVPDHFPINPLRAIPGKFTHTPGNIGKVMGKTRKIPVMITIRSSAIFYNITKYIYISYVPKSVSWIHFWPLILISIATSLVRKITIWMGFLMNSIDLMDHKITFDTLDFWHIRHY